MLGQAVGYAVLGAFSPTALLIGAVYLGSDSPRRTLLIHQPLPTSADAMPCPAHVE